MIELPASRWFPPPDDYEFGTSRPTPDRFDGDDFTAPTRPARAVTFLGRDALEFRQANAAFGTYHEWINLDTEANLPDELFTWRPDDRMAERFG